MHSSRVRSLRDVFILKETDVSDTSLILGYKKETAIITCSD
jgi:hypothetical protein